MSGILAALALLVPSGGHSLFRCRMDQIVRASCCCPMDGSANAGAASGDCCDRMQVHISASLSKGHATVEVDEAASLLDDLPHLTAPLYACVLAPREPVGPPVAGPPLILLKRSLLI